MHMGYLNLILGIIHVLPQIIIMNLFYISSYKNKLFVFSVKLPETLYNLWHFFGKIGVEVSHNFGRTKMFYLLKEDRKFLIDLWNDIADNEDIDPYSELNIDVIENYNRFTMPSDEVPLLFMDSEHGLCGCAILTPLEVSESHPDLLGHNAKWMLHAVNLFFKPNPSISLHPTKIEEIKEKFYSQLRTVVCQFLESQNTKGLFLLREDIASHNEFQEYTRFVVTHETKELDIKGNIIRIIPDIRLYLNEKHIPKNITGPTSNNIVFLKAANR